MNTLSKKGNNALPTRRNAPVVRKTIRYKESEIEGIPWHILPGESEKQYHAFQIYLDITTYKRSLLEVDRRKSRMAGEEFKGKQANGATTRWSKKNLWKHRAAAYDQHKTALAHHVAVEALAKELTSQTMIGRFIYGKTLEALQNKTKGWWSELTPQDLKEFMKLGTGLALEGADRMVDLSIALVDAGSTEIEYTIGSTEEAISRAVQNGEWQVAEELIAKLVDEESKRANAMPSKENQLSDHSKEKVRAFMGSLFVGAERDSETGVLRQEIIEDAIEEIGVTTGLAPNRDGEIVEFNITIEKPNS